MSTGTGSHDSDVLDRLGNAYENLSVSERKVADFVLDHTKEIPRCSLATLCKHTGVSQPTVVRFCRAIGLDGYAHFKVALAASLGSGGAAYVHREIDFDDGRNVVATKLTQSSVDALTKLQQSLDLDHVEAAVDKICAAGRVQLVAVGNSGILALDAYQNFIRLDIQCDMERDTHLQTVKAATLKSGDVLVAFSYTGRIKDLLRTANAARESGAYIIAVTKSDSPLADAADLVIGIETSEDTFVYMPMASRIAHMHVIDLMTTLAAVKRGKTIATRLKYLKETLQDQWVLNGSKKKQTKNPKPTTRS